MTMRSAAVFLQTRGTVLLIAPPPLADGQGTSGKEPGRGFDTTLFDRLDQPQTMVVGVFHLTHEIEIADRSRHGAAILLAARRPALPPAGRQSLFAASDSYTSTPTGGNDVPFQFQASLLRCQSSVAAVCFPTLLAGCAELFCVFPRI